MEIAIAVCSCVVAFVAGWLSGHRLGALVKAHHAWRYWSLNAAAVLLGILGQVAGLMLGQVWLWTASISFLAAALTGLKYGRGAVVGPESRRPPVHDDVEVPRVWED